jgi:hypothetical protein
MKPRKCACGAKAEVRPSGKHSYWLLPCFRCREIQTMQGEYSAFDATLVLVIDRKTLEKMSKL